MTAAFRHRLREFLRPLRDVRAAERLRGHVADLQDRLLVCHERIEALEAERDRLRQAIRSGCDGDYTPQRGKIFRADGKHTKHDQCVHGQFIYAGCEECLCDFLRAALGEAGDG